MTVGVMSGVTEGKGVIVGNSLVVSEVISHIRNVRSIELILASLLPSGFHLTLLISPS